MKKGIKIFALLVVVLLIFTAAIACSRKAGGESGATLDYGDPDLSGEVFAGLESAANYRTRYKNGSIKIGDVMPFYHDGTYSFFYLAETSNHPVYRVDTTDFIHYEDKGEALPAGDSNARDSMIGTGSIVEAEGNYYFFYTGFKKDEPEAIMVAVSEGNVDNFVKKSDFVLSASGSDLEGWDFRDPEAKYDSATRKFALYVSARRGGEPVIAKFSVSLDLSSVTYDGVIYSDARSGFNVLECSDLFEMNGKWYLTYSVQDLSNGGNDGATAMQAPTGTQGKVFYAVGSSPDGPFIRIADAALDSHAFYAAKTISDGTDTYLAGWVRQKGSNLGWNYSWGGNLQVHKLIAEEDGTLSVALPDSVRNYYSVPRELDPMLAEYNAYDLIEENGDFHNVGSEYSSYLLHTYVTFTSDVREAGFALGVGTNPSAILKVAFVPFANKLRSSLNGNFEVASKYMRIVPGTEYDVTLLVEGSCVTMYVDGSIAFTSRLGNIGNKKLAVYANGGTASFRDFAMFTPSDYADTLGSGYGELTVKQNGTPLKGRVSEVAVAPSSPVTIEYKTPADNYLRYTAALYSDKAVTVSVKKNGAEIKHEDVPAGKLTLVRGSTLAGKGEELVMEITSDAAASVSVNASVETDKKPFAEEVKQVASGSGTQSYTAGTSGVYEYVASMYYGGETAGSPALKVGGATAKASENARVVTVRGAVKLAAGERLDASLVYGGFTASPSDPQTALCVWTGRADAFASGVGTVVDPARRSDVIKNEIVPLYQGIEVEGGRDRSVKMDTTTFGEQGKSGFIYAYGRAGDELIPMTEYNTNGEVWEYKHKAPEAADALEIKADFMKQGAGYATALIWIAPVDGGVDLTADYESHADNTQVRVYLNRTLLYDNVLTDGNKRCDITLTGIDMKAGDGLALVVSCVGTGVSEGDGNYHFMIGEGNTTVPYDPTAPVIASYKDDFTVERQGDYGWHYMSVDYTFDGGEHPTEHSDLDKTDYGWGSASRGVDHSGVLHGGNAAVAWVNETDSALGVSVSGSVSGNNGNANAWMRVWVIRADGRNESADAAGFNGVHAFPQKGFILAPGDMIAFIAFDNAADGLTLDITIRCSDIIEIDLTALTELIESARAITNDDGRYSQNSFASLGAAITTASNFLASAGDGSKTYAEISGAVKALKDAIGALELTGSAASEELRAALAEAEKYEGKQLMGDADAFEAALAAAKAAQNGSASDMADAATALRAAMEKVSLKAADFAADFDGVQGTNGWSYYHIAPANWDNYNAGAEIVALTYDAGSQAFTHTLAADRVATVSKELWKVGGTAIVYANYTAESHNYSLEGRLEYLGDGNQACLAYVVRRADGSFEHMSNWNTYQEALDIKTSFVLGAGDELWLVLRDVDGDPTDSRLTLAIGCPDVLTVDKSALSSLIAEATAGYDSGDYTDDSFRALTEALAAANEVVGSEDATVADVFGAMKAIEDAISGLVPGAGKAKADLEAEIERATQLAGRELLGDKDGLEAAILEATGEKDRDGATAQELAEALAKLREAESKVAAVVTKLGESEFPSAQGEDGWRFYKADQNFDGGYHITGVTELPYADGQFKDGDFTVSGPLWKQSGAAIAYFNYTAESHTYRFVGKVEYVGGGAGACLAFVIIRANGSFETVADWNTFEEGNPLNIDRTEVLGAGDALLLVMRDRDGAPTDSKISLSVGCNDELVPRAAYDVLAGGCWSVHRAWITWDPERFTCDDGNKIDFTGSGYEKGGISVTDGGNGQILINADGALAIVFTAKEAGSYRFEFSETSGTRGDGRFFEKKADAEQFTYSDGWIGQEKSYTKEVELAAGDSIAFHFDVDGGKITDLLIRLTATEL